MEKGRRKKIVQKARFLGAFCSIVLLLERGLLFCSAPFPVATMCGFVALWPPSFPAFAAPYGTVLEDCRVVLCEWDGVDLFERG